MRILFLLPTILLSGCLATTPTPVKPVFPEALKDVMITCPELYLVPEDTTKLSETITIVTKNYGLYHECRVKVNTWIEWYIEQKKIYDEIK